MRALVITRGAPGAGKSTWIEQNGLRPYALCADDIRLMYQSPQMGLENESLEISQKNDSKVWATLFELLEERMARGELVIVDAVHSRRSDFSRYNDLAARYRYRRYYVDFSDVPIETCKMRNLMRTEEKRVPEIVIEKMYSRLRTQKKTSGWVELPRDRFWEEIEVKCFDFDRYRKVHVFGDIHGCFAPLEEYFSEYPYAEEDFYIFTGDYIDRGIQNKETLDFLFSFAEKKNVLFLEGNHERWLYYYANDEVDMIRSREFIDRTIPQIADLRKKDIRNFYRRLGQLAYFSFRGKKYLITHGGLSYFPKSLIIVATEQMIKGVGSYETDIDAVWSENEGEKESVCFQIHGHRNIFEVDQTDLSFNLEGKTEFGGELRILQIDAEGERMVKIQNTVYRKKDTSFDPEKTVSEIIPILTQLKNSKDVVEKTLGDGVSSFNFTRHAFYHKEWNALTCKARGLFVDTENETVVARGYEKFFNIGETRETEISHLLIRFKGKPVTAYRKYNGYLGLVSARNGKLFTATKSTTEGDYARWFRRILEDMHLDTEKLLKACDLHTLVFEVIDPENDPHIIKAEKPEIVLLDVVENEFDFRKLPYRSADTACVVSIAEELGLKCKEVFREFKSEREFFTWYISVSDENDLSAQDIEGVVIECDDIMVKYKFPYYSFWKQMRGIADKVRKHRNVNFAALWHPLANYFYAWLIKQDEETLQKDIITLREMFFREQPDMKKYESRD